MFFFRKAQQFIQDSNRDANRVQHVYRSLIPALVKTQKQYNALEIALCTGGIGDSDLADLLLACQRGLIDAIIVAVQRYCDTVGPLLSNLELRFPRPTSGVYDVHVIENLFPEHMSWVVSRQVSDVWGQHKDATPVLEAFRRFADEIIEAGSACDLRASPLVEEMERRGFLSPSEDAGDNEIVWRLRRG